MPVLTTVVAIVVLVALLFVLPAVLVRRDLRSGRSDPAYQESED